MEPEMKKLYQIFEAEQPDGKWYHEWLVEKDFPPPYMFIEEAPPEELTKPKYVIGQGWVEDSDIMMNNLKDENKELKDRLEKIEQMLNNQ